MGGTWEKVTGLRYGENPHQPAALYRATAMTQWLGERSAAARQGDVLQQLCRTPTLRARSAGDFDEPAVAIIKHANPCGIAIGVGRR